MTSSTVTMATASLLVLGAFLTFVVHSEALPVRPLTSDVLDLDREAASTDMVLLTLCWDGHAINPQCQRSKQGRTLLRELLFNLLFKPKTASPSYGETLEDDLAEDEPEVKVKVLRTPSKGKRKDNTSQFYSEW